MHKNKEGRHTEILYVCLQLYAQNKFYNLRLLHRAKATGANRNGLGIATDGNLHLADVGLPTSLRLAMGVGNVLTEHNTLTADTALCHS
jgi:hypothetical protein